MIQNSMDWQLHAEMVFKILISSEYLKRRGVRFTLDGFEIQRSGGYGYCPSKIVSFQDAEDVLQVNGAAGTRQWEAICLIRGVSFHSSLDKGKILLMELGRR